MDGFKKLPKMQCFKEGGSVKSQIAAFERKEEKSEGKKDMAQDKAMVKKGVRQHESALHKGEPKTELKLKSGGRAKKAKGTVKKFEKAAAPSAAKKTKNTTAKFKDGGKVSNVYEAKKSSGDKDNIKKTKQIKPAKAAAASAAKKVKNTPAKFCGGKGVKKYKEGKEVVIDVKDPQALTDKIAREENEADARIIPDAIDSVKRLGQKALNAAKNVFGGKAETAKKKGGKVKKYADGGAVMSDEEKKWLGGADATDPFIQARMRAALGDKKPAAIKPQGSYIPNANAAMDNRDIGMTSGNIDDESQWGNVSPKAAAFNKNIPGAGPVAAAPSAPVARPAMRRPNPAMIEDESKRGIVTPQQQDFNRTIQGSGNAYVAPNVEQDSGVAYPKGGMYANRQPSMMQRFFNATPAEQAASFNKGVEARKNFGRRLGFGGGTATPSFDDQLNALNKPKV